MIDRNRHGPDGMSVEADGRDHPSEYRLIFAVDVVGYGARPGPRKREVQKRIVDLAAAVLGEIDVSHRDVIRQDAGDGMTVVLPDTVEVHRALPKLLHGWRDHLARDNEQFRDRIRIRLALAVGPIARAPLGFDGSTIVEVDRLLNSPPLRRAVVDNPESDLVAMVSQQLYNDVVGNGEPGLTAAEFTHTQVRAKEYTRPAHLWGGRRIPPLPSGPIPRELRSHGRRWRRQAIVVVALVATGAMAWLAVNAPRTGNATPDLQSVSLCDRYQVTARDAAALRDEAGNPTGEEVAGGQLVTISDRRSESGPPTIWLATTDGGATGWLDHRFLHPVCG